MRLPFALALLLTATQLRAADPIELHADLTEAPRRLFKATMKIPAKPGSLTLHYPKWIQGEHQPSGPIGDLSGVLLSAGGKPVEWSRDDVDLNAFHLTVPAGATALDVSLEYLVPADKGGYGAGAAATPRLAILNWFLITLYPLEKGQHVRDIPVKATLTLPNGWQAGTAIPVESVKGNVVTYKTVSLEMLIDSPALCGKHFREIPIGPKDGPPHYLTLACDSEAGLKVDESWLKAYGKLVEEAGLLFGARHYSSYRFLVCLSDQIGHTAIEHHESSDNRVPEKMFTDDIHRKLSPAWVLPHEYVHSWNGKFRRPEGLVRPNFQEPLKTKLLWVYEGLTEYYGFVLAARSGLWATEHARANWAEIADWARNQKGRKWRPLADTAVANHLYAARSDWGFRRRGTDFYDEGALIWLDADTLIREKTKGAKSLDDFCKAFHGGGDGQPQVKAYTAEDVFKALNTVVEHDWKGFFERRLLARDENPPLDGLARSGWKVTYWPDPNEVRKAVDDDGRSLTLTSSLGLLLSSDGKITDVVPGSVADKAGLGPHMKIVATNGRKFDADRLVAAIKETADGKAKLELLVENGELYKNIPLAYTGGGRHPHLERDESKPDLLGDILKPRGKK